jgi:hypothetical protein
MPGRADMSPAIMVILRMFRALACVDAGLTPSQHHGMKLAGAGGERSTRLAQRLAVAKPALTATADGLVAAGYASLATEPGDRRVVRLSLTPAGRTALGLAPHRAGDPGGPPPRGSAHGDGKERAHEHPTAHQHGHAAQQEGGG